MELFFYEEPSMERKEEAIEYILEHYEYKSNINGTGGIQRYLDDYDGWLKKLNEDKNRISADKKVPAVTYFMIRKSDNKIVGMSNIRLALNESLMQYAGNIGYSIRPTERKKGYNNINLYLALLKCKENGLNKVLITAGDSNPASYKTILKLGGILENKIEDDEEENVLLGRYWIDVNKSLIEHEEEYKDYVKESKTL